MSFCACDNMNGWFTYPPAYNSPAQFNIQHSHNWRIHGDEWVSIAITLVRGGRTCFGDIWIFAKFLTGLHGALQIHLFKIFTYYVLRYDNVKSVEVQGWTLFKILIFLLWSWDILSLRFSENAVLFHIEWMCQKTAGNVNLPPYRYIAVIQWACPASCTPSDSHVNELWFFSVFLEVVLVISYNFVSYFWQRISMYLNSIIVSRSI